MPVGLQTLRAYAVFSPLFAMDYGGNIINAKYSGTYNENANTVSLFVKMALSKHTD